MVKVMSEKLTICDALDERDFLRKKIDSAISSGKFICAKAKKDTEIDGVSVDQYKKKVESGYQSITDLIARMERLDVAITQANAETEITLRSGKTMTRAAALTLRKAASEGRSLMERLLDEISSQYDSALGRLEVLNQRANASLENYKVNLVGRDSQRKLTDDEVKVVNALVADLYGELVDPLDLSNKLAGMRDAYNTQMKEIDSAIKVSHATTYIEI